MEQFIIIYMASAATLFVVASEDEKRYNMAWTFAAIVPFLNTLLASLWVVSKLSPSFRVWANTRLYQWSEWLDNKVEKLSKKKAKLEKE